MRLSRFVLASIAGAVVFSSGYLVAQGKQHDTNTLAWDAWKLPQVAADTMVKQAREMRAQGKTEPTPEQTREGAVAHTNAARALHDAATMNTAAADYYAEDILGNYYSEAKFAKTDAEVTKSAGASSIQLQAFQVAQNARIIELLEKIAAKK